MPTITWGRTWADTVMVTDTGMDTVTAMAAMVMADMDMVVMAMEDMAPTIKTEKAAVNTDHRN